MSGNELNDDDLRPSLDMDLDITDSLTATLADSAASLASLESRGILVQQISSNINSAAQQQRFIAQPPDKEQQLDTCSAKSPLIRSSRLAHVQNNYSLMGDDHANKRLKLINSPISTEKITSNTTHVGESADVLRGNRFALLANLTNNDKNALNTANASAAEKKAVFCPPIILYKVNVGILINYLKEISPPVEFKFANVNKYKTKLLLKDVAVHKEFMLWLKEKKVDSYSFTPKDERKVRLVLRGLHLGVIPDDIKAELNSLLPNTVADVTKFSTNFSKKNNTDTGLLLVTLSTGVSPSQITKIKFLDYQRVSWEKPRNSIKEVQCKNCQLWGHLALNCNRPYCCVKCDKNHLPGACNKTTEIDSPAYCANCKSWGHPANWRGCESYQAFIINKKKSMNNSNFNISSQAKEIVKSSIVSSSPIVKGVSYSSHFRRNNEPTGVPSGDKGQLPSLISEFLSVARELLSSEISLEDRISNFMQNFRSLSKDEAISQCALLFKQVEAKYGK